MGDADLDEPPLREIRFGSPLELSGLHWVRPEVVVEVTYLTWTEGGSFAGGLVSGAAGRQASEAGGARSLLKVGRPTLAARPCDLEREQHQYPEVEMEHVRVLLHEANYDPGTLADIRAIRRAVPVLFV